MRKEYFHYKRSYNVPRRWQECIYAIGRLYNERREYAALVDRCILAVAPNHYLAVKQCVVRGDSATKVSIDFCMARSRIYDYLKDYYREMYRALKD